MLLIGSFLALSLPLASHAASASSTKSHHPTSRSNHATTTALSSHRAEAVHTAERGHGTVHRTAYAARWHHGRVASHARWAGISCVPYARSVSGIDVAGNAWQWWDNAVGHYARGSQPEPGSVLSFEANGRMRLGHVAVVSRIVNPREIDVDQANWMNGGVSHDVPVVDVSENNDWTAVRVGLGHSGDFGSVYPTNGFIYDRPDNGRMLAAVSTPAPKPDLNPAPGDLRPYAQRAEYDEVAEAPPPRTIVKRHRIVHRVVHHH